MTSGPAQPQPRAATGSDGDQNVYVPVRRDILESLTQLLGRGHEHDERLRAAAYQRGRQAHLWGGYQAGFTLGHDTGLSARQDTRGYVHGILAGFAVGTQTRQQLSEQLLRRDQARRMASRQPDREAGS
jgi:hypothetical protein